MGQLGDLSPRASIAVGILVGLLSTSIQSLGLTLQRKSHLLEDAKDGYDEVRRPPYRRRRWQLGMGMFIVSNLVGSTIQITTLPLPVLSTLQASGLVFNTAFATLLLHEPFTYYSLIGTVLTCTGAALIAIFGAVAEPAHTLPQLIKLLGRGEFVAWMVVTFVIVIVTLVVAHFCKHRSKSVHESHSHSHSHPHSKRLKHERSPQRSRSKSRGRSLTINLPHAVQLRTSRLRLLRGLAYALISGILSAHSLLVAKSAVELLVRTIVDHVNQFNSYQSWLILLALVFFALSQLYYLHLGLRLCSTSVLYPFVFCVYNIIAILDGLIYFRQTSRLSPLRACLIALGTVILLTGVLALSWRLDDTTSNEAQAPALGPGLGIATSVSDGHSESRFSPLLPTTRPRSVTSRPLVSSPLDESAPLLAHRRKQTISICPPPPETSSTRQIWAELDDSDDMGKDQDVLASLPRSDSPLTAASALKSRQRSRHNSVSSALSPTNVGAAVPFGPRSLSISKRPATEGGEPSNNNEGQHRAPRRSQTFKEYAHKRVGSDRIVSFSAVNAPTGFGGSRKSSSGTSTYSSSPNQPILLAAPSSEGNLSTDTNADRNRSRHGSSIASMHRRGASGVYRDRVRGRPRSATASAGTPAPIPSRWDMSWMNLARWRPHRHGSTDDDVDNRRGHTFRADEEEGPESRR